MSRMYNITLLLTSYPTLPGIVTSSDVILGIAKNTLYVVSITAFVACLVGAIAVHFKRRSSER